MARKQGIAVLLISILAATTAIGSVTAEVYPQKNWFWTGRIMATEHRYSKHNSTMFFSQHYPDTAWHSWSKFDLSMIPDDATIEEASFIYRVVQISNPCPQTYVRVVNCDPVTADPATLWYDVTTGTIASPDKDQKVGVVERPLNAAGIAALQAALSKDWFALSIHKFDPYRRRGVAVGYATKKGDGPLIEIKYSRPEPDIGAVEVVAPTGWVDRGGIVAPQGIVRNCAETDVPFRAWFKLYSPSGQEYSRFHDLSGLAPGQDTALTFPLHRVNAPGYWTARCSVYTVRDNNPANDLADATFYVHEGDADIGIYWWDPPRGCLDTAVIYEPQVMVKNYGTLNVPFRAWFVMLNSTGEIYREHIDLPGLAPGQCDVVYFPDNWVGTLEGQWVVRCTLDVPGDINPRNNYAMNWFWVRGGAPPIVTWGWEEVSSVPWAKSVKPVNKGGWLAYNPGNGLIYGAKGNKTGEFFSYDPVFNSWTELASLPNDGRPMYKGARGVADGGNCVYLAKGNNTLEFWRYDIEDNTWTRLADIPGGTSSKRVKGGSDLAYVPDDGGGVYLLKGGKSDFCRFSVATGKWEELDDAPAGSKPKWGKGSWLVSDGSGALYAHKAKYHELWTYDLSGQEWAASPLTGMPFMAQTFMRKKKSKDGGCADWFDGEIYALKGGNTQEFYRFSPAEDEWTELDTMPQFGTASRRKRVKQGGDFVSFPAGRAFYALKGNKTREFWRYRLPPEDYEPPEVPGPQADPARLEVTGSMSVVPNPVVGGRAQVRLSLPRVGSGVISVVDVTGRRVATREFARLTTCEMSIDLSALSAGVYLIQAETETDGTFCKKVLVMD